MNVYTAVGRLTRDPESRNLSGDKALTKISLAVDCKPYKKDGETNRPTMFIDCDVWGPAAKYTEDNMSKGDMVSVTGEIRLDTWTDKTTNTKRSKHILSVNNINKLFGPKKQDGDNGHYDGETRESAPEIVNTPDIPF